MQDTLRINGIDIHYEETGAGSLVLFIHGLGQSSFCWRGLRDRLPGHRLIALDLKGFGQSDKPDDDKYSVADQATLVSEFIAALDLGQVALVGHSLGGAIALQLALLAQKADEGRVRGLILMDPAAYPQGMPNFMKLFRTPVLGELALLLTPPEFGARLALKQQYYDAGKVSEEAIEAYAGAMRSPGARGALLATARQIIPPNVDEIIASYPQVKVPTLLIWGDHDSLVPLEIGKRLSQDIPGARLEVVENCGHCPQEEMPDPTADLVSGFLRSL